MTLEIFDARGRLRPADSYGAEELSGLSDARRALFDHLREAATALEEMEQALRDATKEVEQAVRDHRAAVEERNRAWPPQSAVDCIREAIACQRAER